MVSPEYGLARPADICDAHALQRSVLHQIKLTKPGNKITPYLSFCLRINFTETLLGKTHTHTYTHTVMAFEEIRTIKGSN